MDVFVVQVETTGLWDATCCNSLCGYGLHCVAEDRPSKAAADRAATAHRRYLRRRIAEEGDRWERMAAAGEPQALEVIRLRAKLRAVEEELEAYRRTFGSLPVDP